jgi:hypothetical protein
MAAAAFYPANAGRPTAKRARVVLVGFGVLLSSDLSVVSRLPTSK